MAEPSNPHNVEGENPEQPVVAADEDEDDDVDVPGGGLPVLKWSKGSFKNLMTTVHMAEEWEATYPQEGDTGADAPAGYITLWADFFTEGNLRLPVKVFVAEVLEYYHLHISQLSPFGMFRIRNFEYTFRAHGLPITVENFRRFYQLTVNTGFFSFNQRHGSLKLMTPPKGVTHWKMKFFYVKACAVYANMTFRDVNIGVSDEDIPVTTAKTVDWFSRLRPIELKKLDNNQLWVLRMMLTRPDRKARPVLREKSGVDAVGLWRMFEPDFQGQVDLIPVELREGFNLEIVGNFRVPKHDVLRAPVPEGEKGILQVVLVSKFTLVIYLLGFSHAAVLADLGKFEKRVPKKHVEKKQVKKTTRGRGKGRAEGSVVSPSVSQAAVVRLQVELLRVPPLLVRRENQSKRMLVVVNRNVGSCSLKGLLRRKRNLRLLLVSITFFIVLHAQRIGLTVIAFCIAESQEAGLSFFDFPLSPVHTAAADAEVPTEPAVPKEPVAPFVRDPTVQVEKTVEKTASQIFDTVDSSDNLISPNEGDGLDLRFSDAGKQKSDAEVRQHGTEPQKSSAGEKVTGSSSGGAGYEGPPIQPGESELEYYYRTYTQDRSTAYHRPP
ncbi:hypothetical protein HanHA89_Chr13g0536431 [Helianthus annuus]|nr:hypothetical protein HanHA89_Chr13g0536431 [Helianthus annuus]